MRLQLVNDRRDNTVICQDNGEVVEERHSRRSKDSLVSEYSKAIIDCSTRKKARSEMMKGLKVALLFMAAALITFGISSNAMAFHSGGVAECGGCHTMHSAKDTTVGALLQGSDQSSTCLNCHGAGSTLSSYHVYTNPVPAAGVPPANMTPGGDFAWLGKTYTFTVRGTATTELGQTHGHNIIAQDFSLTVDTDNPTAPGGTFASANLKCNSCHDNHGQLRRIGGDTTYTWARTGAPIIGSGSYNTSAVPTATQAVGAYRLLRGAGDSSQGVTYNGVFVATAPSTYNQSEATNQVRVAYGAPDTTNTVGQWCATCHPNMHSSGNYVHPVDQKVSSTIMNNYNSYVSSGIMTGSASSAFLSLTPFAESTGDFAVLKTHASNSNAYLQGMDVNSQVTCLSCHRAHATGWPEMLRWNNEGEFITYADASGNAVWPGTDTTPTATQFARGRTSAETQAAYYGRPATMFGAYQRLLCNKCHAKD